MEANIMQADESAKRTSTMAVTGQHILIVDDYASLRHMLREMLENAHYVVSEVGSGKDALDVIAGPRDKRPDLVLLDHYLPDMESTQIQQEMQNQDIDIP